MYVVCLLCTVHLQSHAHSSVVRIHNDSAPCVRNACVVAASVCVCSFAIDVVFSLISSFILSPTHRCPRPSRRRWPHAPEPISLRVRPSDPMAAGRMNYCLNDRSVTPHHDTDTVARDNRMATYGIRQHHSYAGVPMYDLTAVTS